MNYSQHNKPLSLNLDKHFKQLGETEAFYILNQERYLNPDGSVKGTLGKTTPKPANYPACDMEMPAGENYVIGKFRSALTNELYSWVYNGNGVHFIQRINGDGECQVVYHGCLPLNPAPKHSIEQWRAYMKVDKLCANVHGKQLIWTFGEGPIYQLDVEASIATNFFSTPFFDLCGDPCELLRMCVPDPCGCLQGEFIPLAAVDIGKTNNLVDTAYKFSYRHVYYDNRASIWAEPSTLFYQDSKGCFDNSEGFSRCIKLRVPIGNPLVDKIEIGFWKDGVWYLSDTIDKYKKYNNSQQYWYERELSEIVSGSNYSDEDCSFDYIFCNDKQCDSIDVNEFNRVVNPIPRDAQGLIPIGLAGEDRPALGFYNYRQGSCPINKAEIDKFDIQVNCEKETCDIEMATVTVRAVIHNREHGRNQFIYRLGGDSSSAVDDTTDTAWFGGLNPTLDGGFEVGYDQSFKEKTRNFIAYVEGMENWAVMKQWKSQPNFSQVEEWPVVGNMEDVNTRNRWRRATRNGEFFYQEAKIKVVKGTKGFLRLASHHATGNEQSTSTFVMGVINSISNYRGDLNSSQLGGVTNYNTEEIYFDTCDGDVELSQLFLIDDNAVDTGGATKASAFNGYLNDANGNPVEGAEIWTAIPIIGTLIPLSRTDHNGFWHFYLNQGDRDPHDVEVHVERNCSSFSNIKTMSIQSDPGFNTNYDATIEDETWSNDFYTTVRMLVKNCDGAGVSGIRVAISGGKYKSTGADGYVTFKLRNYSARNRQATAIVLNHNGCIIKECAGDCGPCMPQSTSTTPSCYQGTPTVTLASTVINISIAEINKRGLKAGGRYPFGFVVRYGCGKISWVNEIKYLDIPRTQEKGRDGFCDINYNGNGITLPQDAMCLDIVRGENLNPFELQWIVDEIDRTSDGKIKLTIQSLNDYNEKYFFKTNTVYQWLAGDRIEFIKNGDGEIFSIAQHGLLNYLTISPFHDEVISGKKDADANYFNQLLIVDDGKLNDLKEGAIIELQRSKTCTTEPVYFGICASIPVVNGRLKNESGVFTTFDTYFINRTIGALPAQRFEHHSPSDFWGTRITDTGRPYFVNKFENERRYGRSISINAPNDYNFFGALVKTFNQSMHGDITALWLVDDKIGLCISEHDNSLFQVGNDLLRVDGDGIVRALSPDQIISDPQPKLSGSYGCQYSSVGSIYFGDGYATWVDVNRHAHVKHNYQLAQPIDEGKCHNYFRKRCQEVETFNRSAANPLDQYRFVTGYDKSNGAINLTIKSLRHSGINNEDAPYKKPNDTILFHPVAEDYLGFASYTPEGYGELDLFDGKGCGFVAFLNGIPFIHPIVADKWNEFFGVACDWIVGIAMNEGGKKSKIPLAMEIQSDEVLWYVKDVKTDKTNFRSEIPAKRWQKAGRKWNAHFLGNINSRGGLYGDERARGFYAAVTLVRDNTNALQYNTIDNNKRIQYSELDLVMFKFSVEEQAGFEVNL